MAEISSRKVACLTGRTRPPGDKSISHRALMLGALAGGETRVSGLLDSEDVRATARALVACGATLTQEAAGEWRIVGVGTGGLAEPESVLDFGNSGTGVRLMMGLLASHPVTATMTGDTSLRRRPMRRITEPLGAMGAAFSARSEDRLPLTLTGTGEALPIAYTLPVPSAQVKSAILLAALNTPGETAVVEPRPARDHTERMLAAMGAKISVMEMRDGGRRIALLGESELTPIPRLEIPGDISSAAFPLVGAAIRPGSELRLEGVGVNPLRTGLLEAMQEMGAQIRVCRQREMAGEPVADLEITASDQLTAVDLDPALAPRMIDEFPVLFVAAACADGCSRFRGLGELRVKESDRLAVMAQGLAACGVRVEEVEDGLVIHGSGRPPPGGARIDAHLDHRIAMSFLVLGLATQHPVAIEDAGPISTSFPGFSDFMTRLGARMTQS